MIDSGAAARERWRIWLARANGESSDAAAGAYKNFLAPWKDAEPDLPILKEAKAEYAKLQ